jgi:hypothetical protein
MRRSTDRGFVCPLCSTRQYEQATVTLPSGATRATPFFACLGCRVLFLDPGRFTDHKRYVPERACRRPAFGEAGVRTIDAS